ncbi:S8 family peptidase [Congregicoccus parvus]|uniref:S8 family peptidase n=1 Tax=Congregicoccus parvus TaxID=3081749 RepID=UPI003FA5E838
MHAHRDDRLILAYNESATISIASELHARLGASILRRFPALADGRTAVLQLDGSSTVATALATLLSSGIVNYAEPDYLLFPTEEESVTAASDEPAQWTTTTASPELSFDALPDDYNSSSLYGMARVSAPAAWDLVPSPLQNDPEIVVAVIDSGIRYTHEDLAANMWTNTGETPGNGIDDDGNGYIDDVYGINAIAGSGNPWDDNGHGTHCAGTIGAVGDNAKGVVGIAWKSNVRLMALKFLPASGGGSTSDAIECIQYAVAKGAHVLSNSWGGTGSSTSLSNAITAVRSAGKLFVAAAGNTSTNNDASPHYPSSYSQDNIIAVASSDSADRRSGFSCYGRLSVDLFAPGSGILSTHHTSNTAYVSMNGTSMATPLVAGAVAVLLGAYPSEDYLQLRERLLSTVDMPHPFYGLVGTDGRMNLAKAMTEDLTFREDALLWQQSSTGRICHWSMNGQSISSFFVLAQRVVGWNLQAAVDCDGDGDRDLVFFRPSDGSICIWYMEGSTRRSFVVLPNKARGWNLVGIGNFDSHPDVDLVWQHPTTRQVCVWYMRDNALHSYSMLNANVTGWNIVGVRDDDADGNLEIYWHNPTSGQICRWYMNGTSMGSFQVYNVGAKTWKLMEVRDIDADGQVDFRWHHPTTGQLCTWFMDGLDLATYTVANNTAAGWLYVPMP